MQVLTVCLAFLASGVYAAPGPLDGIYALAKRQVPKHANAFTFNLTNGTADSFTIEDTKGKAGGISVTCTTVNACARGFYQYLTEFAGVDIWWTGSRLSQAPSPLPCVGKTVHGQAIVPYRYHFNTVTFGYTTSFWTFEKWSLLLDWLALRGVNLPLAWNGYEYILIEVFREAGLSDAEIADFLSGPAFLPWNRFGNIQGSWGGELPMQWVNDQFALQKQILERMVELGMTPVLPPFTGFVPKAMTKHYPNASIVIGGQWSGFPATLTNTSFLEPFDPLFATLQKSFISKQQAAYGNISHIYTLDQYNENNPSQGDLDYLRNVTSNTFASLRAADPEAIWLMQGWLFFSSATFWTDERIEAYLGGVEDNDAMIILDLYSEAQPQWNRTQNYYGKSWVWCELHDFGGNMGLEGNLVELASGPIAALNSPNNTMKGMGLTMEGQEGNEIVYDFLLDQAWSSTPISVVNYVRKWAARRYPVAHLPSTALDAWSLLGSTVFSNQDPNSQATIKSIFELSPSLTGLVNRTGHHPTLIPYNTNTTILPALQKLVQASETTPALRAVPEFHYDIVDLGRQLTANRFLDHYATLLSTYNNSKSTSSDVTRAGNVLIQSLKDLDSLLSTDENFLLSTWIGDARQWAGSNASYAAYLEYNARNQITLWGPDGEINDYASKQWAGLVGEYYVPRWQSFVSYLADLRSSGGTYNATVLNAKMLDIGKAWGNQTWGKGAGETWGTKGDAFQLVKKLL